jgi:hypothetical protein
MPRVFAVIAKAAVVPDAVTMLELWYWTPSNHSANQRTLAPLGTVNVILKSGVAVAELTNSDMCWLAAHFVWFTVVRVAYAFEDTDTEWRGGDPGDPEKASDGYGDMEGGCHE